METLSDIPPVWEKKPLKTFWLANGQTYYHNLSPSAPGGMNVFAISLPRC